MHEASVLCNAQLTTGEYHQFYIYFPMIKKLLFDTPHDNPIMTMTLYTNVNPNDYEKLSIILHALESATEEYGIALDSKHIEIRHNSPNVIDFFLSGQLQDLIMNFQSIYNMIRPVLADVASILTIGSMVAQSGKELKTMKAIKDSVKDRGISKISELRREINSLHENDRENYEHFLPFDPNINKTLLNNLTNITEKLVASGICINNLEVQFLDGKNDIMDYLYHQKDSLFS